MRQPQSRADDLAGHAAREGHADRQGRAAMISTVNRIVLWDGDVGSIEAAVWEAVAPAVPVRWAIVAVEGVRLAIEAAVWEGAPGAASDPPEILGSPGSAGILPASSVRERALSSGSRRDGRGRSVREAKPGGRPTRATPEGTSAPGPLSPPFVAAQILPTGIGLQTGGYAGDGTPATNLLAAACDVVVTHPNAVNAALFNWAAPNVLYVEGALLDEWLAGRIALRPIRSNRIGLLVDRGVADAGGMTLVENAAGAFRTVGGGTAELLLTAEPLALTLFAGDSGASHGSLGNPHILLQGARRLLERGAEAIALVADFSRLPLDAADYLAGRGPDPIGGLEAVLSRAIALSLGVPCAHAPYLTPSADACDPRAAAEELHGGFITSILRGLQRAPRPIPAAHAQPGDLPGPDLLLAPHGALGGPGTLAAAARGIPIVAVHNPSVLGVGAAELGIPTIPAASYLEAAGVALACKAGMDPHAFHTPKNDFRGNRTA